VVKVDVREQDRSRRLATERVNHSLTAYLWARIDDHVALPVAADRLLAAQMLQIDRFKL
jgi:hypothetical protein